MALPPKCLLSGDLFIVNRITTVNDVDTYKINTDDIGIFLLDTPQPGGGSQNNKYVNDGEINIYGQLQNLGASYLNLHSANEYCEGKLSFDHGFHITGSHMDVLITHDYSTLSKELTCDDGGIDGSTTCMKLDMVWLSENIVCSGLEATGNCIGINLCDDISGLTFGGDGCLHINLCPDNGIIYHPNNGCLQLDLKYLSNSLNCDGLRPAGGNPNSTCMEIDMAWLTDNIRCGSAGNSSADGGSGLIDGGGCISVDPCWVNNQLNTSNKQYLISDYDATSIDTANCKLRVNEAWLLKWAQDNILNIEIHEDALCLEIDDNKNLFEDEVVINLPEDCMKTWTEGVIDGKIKNIIGLDGIDVVGPNANVANGTVSLQVNESYIQGLIDLSIDALPDPADQCDGKLTIKVTGNGSVVGNKTYDPCGDPNQSITINVTGGGTGGPTPNDGTLKIKKGDNGIRFLEKSGSSFGPVDEIVHSADTADDSIYKIDIDPASCPDWTVPISGQKLFLKASGGGGEPTLVMGTKKAADGACIDGAVKPNGKCEYGRLAWLGVSSNQQNGSFTCHRGIEGWEDYDNCGGKPTGETERLFSVAAGTKVLPHHASAGIITSGSGLAEDLRIFKYNQNPGANDNGIVGGRPDQGLYNRFCFRKVSFLRGEITELSRASDTRVNLDIDNVLDTFGGYADDPAVSDGIFRWGNKPMDESPDHKYPFLFIDPYELGAKLPGFVDFTPDASSWEVVESRDDDGELIDADFRLKDDFDPTTQLEIGAVNWQALHALAIAALVKHKNRIVELEAKTTREGTLNTLGIIEYTNETAAANSGLGQGEVYWDLELDRMRAVT